MLLAVNVKDIDHMLDEDIQVLKDRLVKKAKEGNEIWVNGVLAKRREAEAEAKKVAEAEAKAMAEAKAEEEARLAKEEAKEEERLAKKPIADEESRIAEEKRDEEREAKRVADNALADMRSMFGDVK